MTSATATEASATVESAHATAATETSSSATTTAKGDGAAVAMETSTAATEGDCAAIKITPTEGDGTADVAVVEGDATAEAVVAMADESGTGRAIAARRAVTAAIGVVAIVVSAAVTEAEGNARITTVIVIGVTGAVVVIWVGIAAVISWVAVAAVIVRTRIADVGDCGCRCGRVGRWRLSNLVGLSLGLCGLVLRLNGSGLNLGVRLSVVLANLLAALDQGGAE